MSRSLFPIAALICAPLLLQGCNIIAPFGGLARNFEKTAVKEIDAKYSGLQDKTFAVVVSADRMIQADFPSIVGDITLTVSRRLADPENDVGASGYVPGVRVLEFQYNNPRWVAMTMPKLAEELGVERLVFIDLSEFRLNDPGNQYLWAALAAGSVHVYEVDGPTPSIAAFSERISVKYPDKEGLGPAQIPGSQIEMALAKRFVDRIGWLFYKHEERNDQGY
ncbi:MAG: hypothetical protein KF745_04480 [Phycisphaeraceae bacterium]|nr:hypothetical protein [Phycisphaeraceae bacterium]